MLAELSRLSSKVDNVNCWKAFQSKVRDIKDLKSQCAIRTCVWRPGQKVDTLQDTQQIRAIAVTDRGDGEGE